MRTFEEFRNEAYALPSPPRDANPNGAHVLSQFPRLSTDETSSASPDSPEPLPGCTPVMAAVPYMCNFVSRHSGFSGLPTASVSKVNAFKSLYLHLLNSSGEESPDLGVQLFATIRNGLVKRSKTSEMGSPGESVMAIDDCERIASGQEQSTFLSFQLSAQSHRNIEQS